MAGVNVIKNNRKISDAAFEEADAFYRIVASNIKSIRLNKGIP
ncbi:MAG TPA: hypothetical protein VHQ24_09335 [Lachnospiraceae bacterium]|nr:hypothetical protein [Lachnospiraceae bacterium]